jgi:hypothetical protein
MPCSDHAALKATSQGHGTARHGQHGMCELASVLSRRPVGGCPRLLTRMLMRFGMCLTVLMTMEKANRTEYKLTLKLKPVFVLLLRCVSIVYSSSDSLWATTL